MGGAATGARRRAPGSAKKGAAPPPPDPLELFLDELKIAATVAASLVVVIMARRWASRWLGEGALHPDILAGGTLATLTGQVAQGYERRKARHEQRVSPAAPGTDDVGSAGGPAR